MFLISGLIWIFGFILILVAVVLVVEGIERKDEKKIAGGAALGLGVSAGLKYWSDQQEDRKKQLQAAASEEKAKLQRRR